MILVPLKAGRGKNDREHWRTTARRVKAEKHATAWMLKGREKPEIPCTVLLTRVAPSGGLDDDNLSAALKNVRDQVATWLGVDDKHSAQVRYRYAQCRGAWSVRIEFGPPSSGAQLVLGEFAMRPFEDQLNPAEIPF